MYNYNRYNRRDLIKFLQFQEDFPQLFLSEEDELNGGFWGDADDDYTDVPNKPVAKYNDDLKSDKW